jgi:hypothetical protein
MSALPIDRVPPEIVTPLEATSLRALAYRPIEWCACFDGMCRCEVVNGRTRTGAHCKAHAGANLQEDAS